MTVKQNEYGNYIIELQDEKPLYYLYGIRVLSEEEYLAHKRERYREWLKENNIKKQPKAKLSESFIQLIRKTREEYEKKHTNKKQRIKRKSNKTPTDIIQEVLNRDNHTCVECGATDHLEVHHMVYRSQGGTHTPDNLITLCWMCHAEKHKEEPVYNLMSSRIRKELCK